MSEFPEHVKLSAIEPVSAHSQEAPPEGGVGDLEKEGDVGAALGGSDKGLEVG